MIKRCISVMFIAAAISSGFLFLSCNTPQDVLNDYNKHFEKVPAVTHDILETGNAHLMLQELYKVDITHTLVLTAPLGCESYSWKITDVGGKNVHLTQSNVRLAVYIPDTPLHAAVLKADGKSRIYDVTLTVKYKGKDISDVLNMTIDEAVDFFENICYYFKYFRYRFSFRIKKFSCSKYT